MPRKGKVATQPDGMPQGRHMQGFKGTKAEGVCICGGCHPNAKKNKDKVIYA